MNSNKLQKNIAIFLATILVTGVSGISSLFTVFAQGYDGHEYDDYGYDQSGTTQTNNGVIGLSILKEEHDGHEYDDYGYEKEYKKSYDADYDHDHDYSGTTNIIINDQDSIGIGIKPNVQNCAPNNIYALLTSGDEGVDCHNQRDQTSDPDQDGTD